MASQKPTREFTADELRSIRLNPYVKSATTKQIRFTVAFKEEFWKRYNEDCKSPKTIVEELGFDSAVLGQTRINGILMHIRQEANSEDGFHDVRRPQARKNETIEQSETVAAALRRMQHQIEFMSQELDFIKKLSYWTTRQGGRNDACQTRKKIRTDSRNGEKER